MNYFSLSQEIKSLYEYIEKNGIEDAKDTLEGLLLELEDKVRFYFQLRQNGLDKISFYKTIVEKYNNLIEKENKNISYAEERLLDIQENFGEVDIKDEEGIVLFKVKTKLSEAVIVKDVNILDERYLRVKTLVEPDKTLIKKALKEGELTEDDNVYIEKRKNLFFK